MMFLRQQPKKEYVTYKYRWLIITIFVLYSASNSMQWTHYSIIADVVSEYYGVPIWLVPWTSMVYMVTYIPLIFPASFLLTKLGLRMAVIIGATGTCAGTWIKVFSVAQDMFWLGFLGQTVVAISQVFILNVPPRLAAVWFGPNQVSTACSIGVFGNQLGVSLGFVLPPMFVPPNLSVDETKTNFRTMFLMTAIFTSALLLAIVAFFRNAPATPASHAAEVEGATEGDFGKSLKALLTNRNYVLLLFAYGLNVGVFYAISTLLNQVILQFYPNAHRDTGRIGLTLVGSGMIGSVVCGFILDKTHRFKETTLAVYCMTLIGMFLFTFLIESGIAVVYLSSILLGFFMTGLLPVGFELASELTFPEPEGTTSGLLNAAVQVFGIAITVMFEVLLCVTTFHLASFSLCALLVIGTVFTACIKSDLRRQTAQKS